MKQELLDLILNEATLHEIENAIQLNCYFCESNVASEFYLYDDNELYPFCTACRDKLIIEFKEREADEANYKREIIAEGAPTMEYLRSIK